MSPTATDTSQSVSLSKGGNVSLSKHSAAAGGLTTLAVGLGWEPRVTSGDDYDLDAFGILCAGGKATSAHDLVMGWGPQMAHPSGAVTHTGDNTDGQGDGDDEIINVDLTKVPDNIEEILFVVAIAGAKAKGNQNFGDISGAYIRIVNSVSNEEMVKFDLSEEGAGLTTVVFGKIYRDPGAAGEWKFKAIEQGFPNGLASLVEAYGIHVDDPAAYDEGR